jgi:hypothetical protein
MQPEPPDPARDTLERALGATYRILRLLGRGGMGAVYLAREEALERLVAIKVLRADLEAGAEAIERFRREARTAAQLTHPHIVPLLGFGEAEGLLYLVLGYVQGESLAARLRRQGRITADEARRILADVAEALDYAHRKGVVHRDVKPDNILIDDETGRAVLADFGIAKGMGAAGLTQSHALIGTPQYMSPEQLGGEASLDGRSDLYSLGMVGFAMLAGRPAFASGAAEDGMMRRLREDAPPLTQVVPEVPEDLSAVIARCLRRDRDARWPNARALREAVSPTTLEADELPDPLDTLDGAVPFLIPFAIAFVAMTLMWLAGEVGLVRGITAATLFAFLLLQVPILWSAARSARARGFTSPQVVGALFRQPGWWPFWYPERFRRPGDVYARLPRTFRVWRVLVTVAVATLGGLALLLAILQHYETFATRLQAAGAPSAVVQRAMMWSVVGLLALLAVTTAGLVATAVAGARRMRALGHDVYTLRRVSRTLLVVPTGARGPWRKPEVAALLAPAAASVASRPPPDPAQAIRDLARDATTAERGLLEDAAAAACAAALDLASCEARIARASRHAEAAETDRLRAQLADLAASDDPRELELRAMVARQLEWHEQSMAGLAEARAARAGLEARLLALWRAADELARHPRDDGAMARLRVLCDGIGTVGATPSEDSTATRPR